jgi:phytoene dehydrogenase-like protein
VPDSIVIGAGHNGLVAANILADHGLDVLVLEAAGEPGGAVRTGEITVPGFRHDLFSAFYPLAVASPVIGGLGLEDFGLAWRHAPLVLANPLPGGRCVAISTDLAVSADFLEREHPGDGDAYRRMIARWSEVAQPLLDALFRPFPPVGPATSLAARLGPAGTLRLARDLLLPVRRMGEEWFGGEGARLLLAGSALHADLPPESAGSGAFGWLMVCLAQRFGFPVPEGGAGSLIAALVRRLESRGGQLQCGRRVAQVNVRRGRVVGVRTAAGDEIDARHSVLAAVPATSLYLQLVDEGHLPASVLEDVSRFHWDAATVKVDWALSEPVPWEADEVLDAGAVHLVDSFDELTEHAADLATRRLPRRPFMIFGQQSRADPTRAPEGADTAWAYTHLPRELVADGAGELDVEDEKWVPGFVERMEQRIESHAPGFRDRVLGRHVFTPAGLEREDENLVGGAINGGTAQLHQQLVLRPVPGWGRPETPIAGLYLASSSAHPGGGVHGAPGANAARAALAPARRLRAAILGRGGRAAFPGTAT